MEVTVTSDSLEATSVSPEYLVPKPQRLLQILMRKWSKIMKVHYLSNSQCKRTIFK